VFAYAGLSFTHTSTRRDVALPDVARMQESSATRILDRLGLPVSIQSRHSQTVPPGVVFVEEPFAGSTPPEGSTVTLVVSSGP
jgi:serine/threonine-protein kinase